jgi:heme/copper-type cytochrome/quinol oxidase subunit 2
LRNNNWNNEIQYYYLFFYMNKKILAPTGAIAIILMAAFLAGCAKSTSSSGLDTTAPNNQTPTTSDSGAAVPNDQTSNADTALANAPVHEIDMESFDTMDNGNYTPQFSLKEITVKKGEKVKININDTKGQHNFNIDEFNVHSETPTGVVTAVEFTPDKTGQFIYYCSKPHHRELGQWGTLTVTE